MPLTRAARIATACLVATILSAAGASVAGAADFTNSQPVKITDLQGTDPYPSTVDVSGLGARTTKVTLTIDLDHSAKSDLEVLLVGPRGTTGLVMSDAAGSSASPVVWTFDDAAASTLRCDDNEPEPPSGSYRPTNCERFPGDSDALYAPAPQPQYAGALGAFDGTDPNGTWRLYVADVGSGDDGTLKSWKLSIEASQAPPDPPRPVGCPAGNSRAVTCRPVGSSMLITASAGNDTIVGTSGRDVVRCGAGNDTVTTGAGDDEIRCGPGTDRLIGGRGDDRLLGGPGDDALLGGSGADLLAGGRGNDRLVGGPGNDRLVGGPGNDRLVGGSGRDRLSGGSGRNRSRQ